MLIWLLFGLCIGGNAQCPVIAITNPIQACQNENIRFDTPHVAGTKYNWDFCAGDLQNEIVFKGHGTTSGGAFHQELVSDGNVFRGFISNTGSLKLTRMDYDQGLDSAPTVTNVDLSASLVNPRSVRIIKDGEFWFGLLIDLSQNKIFILRFGRDLTSTPQITDLNISGLSTPQDLDLVKDGSQFVAAIVNFGNTTLTRLIFANTMEATPSVINESIAGANPISISLQKHCNQWFGFTTNASVDKVTRISFGNSLNGTQTNDLLNMSLSGFINLRGISTAQEADNFFVFVSTEAGKLFRFDFGNDPNLVPLLTTVGTLSQVATTNGWGIELYKNKSSWYLFYLDYSIGQLTFNFHSDCSFTQVADHGSNMIVSYPVAGVKTISLEAIDASGVIASKTSLVTIRSVSSPVLILTKSDIVCKNVEVDLEIQSSSLLNNMQWDFGDGSQANDLKVTHAYSNTGIYAVTFSGIDANGCTSEVQDSLEIYNSPISTFIFPTGLICTNNEFTFTNNTVDNYDGNLSYQWLVDNNPQSTSRDLKYAFTSQGNKEIKLITSIPGCSDEDVQMVMNVQAGPTVGFTIDGRCEGDKINFTNTSSGDISGYVWDSGNLQTGTGVDFSHTYNAKGIYDVTLKTTGINGCVSTTIKLLTIYSKPTPNFSLDLPPFSCSGTPSQFNDLTLSPTDSNLALWEWNFGDGGTASTDRNPLHTYTTAGDYNVSLAATTNFGCSATVQKTVTITASPPADFTYTPSCINQGTRFTDASGSGVKSWLWTIGGSTYSFSNPTHVFSSAGNYSAKLTVTGNNNCVATVTKTINVLAGPTLNFSAENACEKQFTVFKDTSPAANDPAVSRSWDFAGQRTATGNTVQYAFTNAGTYAVKMTSTQQSGCVYSLSKNIVINAVPVASFTSSPEWGVPPLAVQFTNTSTGASSYSWQFNDKNNSKSTLASPNFQFTELGDYVVDLTATSALGCSTSASGKISVIVPSLDLELKQLQLVKDPASNVYRIFVTLKNKSNYPLTSVDVVVDISGNALIKETINTNLPPDAEIVQLLNNQILPHGKLLTYLCASIEVDNDNDPFNNSKCEPVEEETVVFAPYPNPSNGRFRFEWISPATDNAHFEIFNAMGQLVFEQYAESVQVGLNQVQFDLNNLGTGAYYFRFSSNAVTRTLPIQIVR